MVPIPQPIRTSTPFRARYRSAKLGIYFACLTLVWSLSAFLIYRSFTGGYLELRQLSESFASVLTGVVILIVMLYSVHVEMHADRVVFHSSLGLFERTIKWAQVESWYVTEVGNDKEKAFRLRLRSKDTSLMLQSGSYEPEDFATIVETFRKNCPEAERLPANRRLSYRNIGIAFAVSLLGFSYAYGVWYKSEYPIQLPELQRITGTLARDPELRKDGNGDLEVWFRLRQYPEWIFELDETAINAARNEAFGEQAHQGDTLSVAIPAAAYRKKLVRTAPMSYLDRHWNYESISIIELADRKQVYLTLAGYNAENRSTWAGWVVFIFGAGMLYATVGLFYRLSNR